MLNCAVALSVLLVAVGSCLGQSCVDTNDLCPFWANEHMQCEKNAVWMKTNCPAACDQCSGPKQIQFAACNDDDQQCAQWASSGECKKNPYYMMWKCEKSCTFCTQAGPAPYPTALPTKGAKGTGGHPMGNQPGAGSPGPAATGAPGAGSPGGAPATNTASGTCTDTNVLCPFWASKGECTANAAWMGPNCPAACSQCTSKQITYTTCADTNPQCAQWSQKGECTANVYFMAWSCAQSCGFCKGTGPVAYPAGFSTGQGPSGQPQPAQTQNTQPAQPQQPQNAPAQQQTQNAAPIGQTQSVPTTTTTVANAQTQPTTVFIPASPTTVATTTTVATAPTTVPTTPATTTTTAAPTTTTTTAAPTTTTTTAAPTTTTTTAAPTTTTTTAAPTTTTTTAAPVTTQPVTTPVQPQTTTVGVTTQVPIAAAAAFQQQQPVATAAAANNVATTGACVDSNVLCPFWNSVGECTNNPTWMQPNCVASCTSCTPKQVKMTCQDTDPKCSSYAAAGVCTSSYYMIWKCPKACQFCTADGNVPIPAISATATGTGAPNLAAGHP